MKSITSFFAYIVVNPETGEEGVPAFLGSDGTWYPMMGTNEVPEEMLEDQANAFVLLEGVSLTLVRSTGIEIVKTITPETAEHAALAGISAKTLH